MMTLDEAVAKLEEFGPNCALGICCPPGQQREVLARAIQSAARDGIGGKIGPAAAGSVAAWILDHFDLAPKDSITPLLRKAGELAREQSPQP